LSAYQLSFDQFGNLFCSLARLFSHQKSSPLAAAWYGLAIIDIVTEGAQRRLRPVMMTATICAFGLVPLLMATGPGSEIQKPLAIVVIGGLISSTLLTLFLFPLVYLRTTQPLNVDATNMRDIHE